MWSFISKQIYAFHICIHLAYYWISLCGQNAFAQGTVTYTKHRLHHDGIARSHKRTLKYTKSNNSLHACPCKTIAGAQTIQETFEPFDQSLSVDYKQLPQLHKTKYYEIITHKIFNYLYSTICKSLYTQKLYVHMVHQSLHMHCFLSTLFSIYSIVATNSICQQYNGGMATRDSFLLNFLFSIKISWIFYLPRSYTARKCV